MFDADGEFIYEHDLEAGLWDGHGYDCSSPVAPCDCQTEDEEGLETFLGFSWIDEDGNFHDGSDEIDDVLDDDEIWTDLATYVDGR